MVASCTPCDRSGTSSLVGQRVAVMRRRISASASSGTSTRNGWMLDASLVVLVSATGTPRLGVRFDAAPRWEVFASPARHDVHGGRHPAAPSRAPTVRIRVAGLALVLPQAAAEAHAHDADHDG